MPFDAHKNLAIATVVTAPNPATTGTTLGVTAGQGARFPAVPFNATVWPATAAPDPTNAEIVRVTARTTDTLTITRAQETTTARTIGAGDLIAATITAKTLADVESGTNFPLLNTPGTLTVGGVATGTGQPFCMVVRVADQSIPNAAWTPIAFDTEAADIGNCFALAAPTRVVGPAAGVYLALGEITFANNAVGDRYVQLMKNDVVGLTIGIAKAFQTDVTTIQVRALAQLAAGDYVNLRCFQNGAALVADQFAPIPLNVTANCQMVKLW